MFRRLLLFIRPVSLLNAYSSKAALQRSQGKVLWEDPVWESRNWQTEWQSFSGNDRALNGQSLKSADPFPPPRGRLYDSMRDELAGDVARRLQTRYKRS